ncbi:MAG: hypothetical protein XXXJIFNMEKO3_01242 [Candidatus Erwinia impunctatus]|nr:hypothetical protein XXXJIFNMEKO_01242 [Culicoides impunctatus]
MSTEKEISIDQFTATEKIAIQEKVAQLTAKLSHPASQKEEKQILRDAKKTVMKARLANEALKASQKKVRRKPAASKAIDNTDFSWSASRTSPPRARKTAE